MSGTQGLHDLGINIDLLGRTEQRTACPQCSKRERDKSLGVNIQSGAYHCFRCGWKGRASGAWDFAPIVRVDDPAVAQRKRERLRRTWNESVPLSHSKAHAVRVYLESRALGAVLKKPPTVLRAHPRLPYWDGHNNLGSHPALIALFHGAAGQPTTLSVTYLRGDGCAKANVPNPKKILGVPVAGSTKGGSIRLYDPSNGVLGVAEGIESALSLHLLQHIPTWAAFCADNMTRTQLPPGLSKLYIGVDIDMSGKGEQVARALATRVSKRRSGPMVLMVTPEGPAPRDLNDELRQRRAV
jgi:predicted RNA-binding Zn-ribbon protein involved in translation (DUF1610 family)